MKILHTSDLHIGKKLYSHQRKEEQQDVLDELVLACRQEDVDVVLVAGDLFDNFTPSVESMKMLFDALVRMSENGRRAIVLIAGNHDSADRIDMPDSFARTNGIFFLGNYDSIQQPLSLDSGIKIEKTVSNYIQIRINKYDYPLQLVVTPFVNEERLKTYFDGKDKDRLLRDFISTIWEKTLEENARERGVKILMTHLFVLENEQDERTEPEDENAINIGGLSAIYSENIPSSIQYAAFGHLHRCQRIGKRHIWYSGSPLAYSFAEEEQEKYFLIIDIEPDNEPVVVKRPVRSGYKLKNLKAEGVEKALELLNVYKDYWVQLHLVTPQAISYQQTLELHQAHEKLIQIIPEIESRDKNLESENKILELRDNPTELFKEFYRSRNKGLEPEDDLVKLFEEVINKEDETD